MPYCPNCFIEYVEGTDQCEDCGANLLPGSPPENPAPIETLDPGDVKLVPVRVFAGGTAQMNADLARNILQSQGIPCILQGETSAEMLPGLDVPVLVREQDAARADRILRDYSGAKILEDQDQTD
jgi:hypothetical protein